MIRVIFLAQLREQLGIAELDVSSAHVKSLDELKQQLVLQNPSWESTLLKSKVLTAVNHAYTKGNQTLVDGDEVAFFPPVTGG
ncbi:molybdopterin synthase sulfur carrier subunit [Cellvibrio sp. KY-GH-1]|uniref:MoaD/ThiS family protein n=1 Tax=Cellvibrio sp. KY-GH-1 TaxID=2303332 RepID=UPI00124746C5|nr:MoaD/ThiS family protein [Cellvibrio sp. KY-GH-1]QEY15415.1 molybdopterin synthase sulfur carrier subunit [Cellvibrio sp. KY-GH-1]